MFAMLVFAAAFISFNFVHSRVSNQHQFDLVEHVVKIFSEDDMTPDFTEQLGSHDHTTDVKQRHEKNRSPQNEAKTTTKPVVEKRAKYSTARNLSEPAPGHNASEHNTLERNASGRNASGRNALERNASGRNASGRNVTDGGEKRHIVEEIDVVDREDHVTQYLSDQLVNTDSEITSLQASDAEDERRDSLELNEDSFFAFLTGKEKSVEIDGAWSRAVDDVLLPKNENQENVIWKIVENKD